MVHEPLASVLRSGRDLFNAKFAEARRKYPELDGTAFADFIQSTLDPIAQASSLSSEQLTSTLMAGYDVGLEIVGERLAGNDKRGRMIEEAWRQIAPANWSITVASPHQLLAAISNAVHLLSSTPASRPTEWITNFARLAPKCPDFDTLLKVGQVLSWRAGLAQFRSSALEVADNLPESLALAAVGAHELADWHTLRELLAHNVWFDPCETNLRKSPTLRVVAKIGAFRGLGGNFSAPPTVTASGDELFVRSGDQCWLLMADVFGHSLHHVKADEFERAAANVEKFSTVRVTAEKIIAEGREIANPAPGDLTSYAITKNTIAVTSSFSHAIVLVAR